MRRLKILVPFFFVAGLLMRVAFEDEIRTFRISTNTLGGGFVECISNSTLLAIRDRQPENMRGAALTVPVLEANSSARRAVRVEESTREPRIVFRRRVSQRNGNYKPLVARREYVVGPRRQLL